VTSAHGRWPGLSRRDLPFAVAMAFALLVHVPALLMPFTIDDFAQREMVTGAYPSAHPGAFGLYDFIDDANRGALLDRGIVPWWTHPHLVVRFLRPLSSLTLALDYRLAPESAWWGHVHSLLWWGAAVVLVYLLLARLLPRRVARLGVFVFAVSPCHAIPLAWLANREALVSVALGTAALVEYVMWRGERRLRDGLATLALFGLAMAAGEYSLCFAGYVVAFEVVQRRESVARRAIGLAPFVVPAIAYLLARAALHYGAKNGGMYHDPFWNFGGFAPGALFRLVVLLTTAWLGLDEVTGLVTPGLELAAMVAVTGALLVVPVRCALRALDEPARGSVAWLAIGSFLSLLPLLAVEPSARLLGSAMTGISAVVALVIDRAWFPPQPEPRRGVAEFAGFVALAVAFVHLVRAPATTLLNTRTTIQVARATMRGMDWVREHMGGKSSVVVLRADSLTSVIFAPCTVGGDVQWRVLSYETPHVLVLRTGERSLEVVASPRPAFTMGPREVFRDNDGSLRAGDSVAVAGMRATVLQLDKDGMPRRVRYDFDRDLSDPSILWINETRAGFEEEPVPQKGQGEPITP
jgi:hypothetical protein